MPRFRQVRLHTPELMATKRRKHPTANESRKAPIGAREIPAGNTDHFCAFSRPKTLVLWFACLAISSITALAQPAAQKLTPNLKSNIERPLRYRPDGPDFVIENGAEFFNRPLYGGNTAFRVDGGDKPEFVLYLPGRGGNLRLGINKVERADPSAFSSAQRPEVRPLHQAKWLHEAAQITTRYRPGELLYEIRDPLLGPNGVLRLAALAYHQTEGLIVRAEATDLAPGLELVWAYGGVNGQRGSRDGDIGTERVPISQWFQLSPDFAKDNQVELAEDAFTVKAKPATIAGLVPTGSRLTVGDARQWNDLPTLLNAVFIRAPDHPVVVGRAPLANGTPLLLSLQRVAGGAAAELDTYKEVGAPQAEPAGEKRAALSAFRAEDLPHLFTETETHFTALRNRVSVETPDPFINAAVGALNVAADAVWDEPQQAIMHGAIAWRTKLLGWRGPYALDALGWHDRAKANLAYWAGRQNTDPIPAKLPPGDEKSHLARNEVGLHSNGDISNSHYDMNLVFIDGLFRHLLWTGDVEFAKKMWPVIERHLAWERRLFRREFGPEKLPLYEAYAAIWASDDLQYSGGGTAHASAYNYWHNRMAARLAPLAGADPAPYTKEADLIGRAMRLLLWTGDHFAESKDLLGNQLVHPSAALWTFYHTMDSEVPTREEAEFMVSDIVSRIPYLPVRGPGVPGGLHMLATSDWLPYTWSINNVTMNENAHTALGFWQADHPDGAFHLLKGSLVASMFMGISPGNVGTMNYLDVYRRESQRDFGDGSGALSRAVVEGLFGVRPNVLAGELIISTGFPEEWSHATLHHPLIDLAYEQGPNEVRYTITSRFQSSLTLRLQLPTYHPTSKISINGASASGRLDAKNGRLEISARLENGKPVTVSWHGSPQPSLDLALPTEDHRARYLSPPPNTKLDEVAVAPHFNDRVTAIFQKGKYLSPRSPFVSLGVPSQGLGYWAGHVNATAEIDDTGLRAVAAANGGKLTLPNGVTFATPGPGDAKNILFTSQWDNYPHEATVPLTGKARQLHLLMAGSTNAMQSRLDNGEVVVTYTDGTTSRLALRNPETWWPIEQDYFTDDYQFRVDGLLPTRVDLKTGAVRVLDAVTFKGKGGTIPGGAATVLELSLDPAKELKSLTVRALANDVVIGLMAATLAR